MTAVIAPRFMSSPAAWAPSAASRVGAAPAGHAGSAAVAAVAGVTVFTAAPATASDDPFAKALERSRDAARAQRAQDDNRSKRGFRTNDDKPETLLHPLPPVPVPAPVPAEPANAANPAHADPSRTTKTSEGDAHEPTDAKSQTPGAAAQSRDADAATRKARAQAAPAAGKPSSGNGTVQKEAKEPATDQAPDSTDSTDSDAAQPAGATSQGATPDAATVAATVAANASATAATARTIVHTTKATNASNPQRLDAADDTQTLPGGPVKRTALADTRVMPIGASVHDTGSGADSGAGSTREPGTVQSASSRSAALLPQSQGLGASSDACAQAGANAEAGTLPSGPVAAFSDLRSTAAFTLATRTNGADTAESTLQARPGTADFAPQLGAQLAVWVKGGVQEARLQLNPADMGPVRVDIQLDGTAAQVSFFASNDDSRQALQDALPCLAGCLREAGFTLAGGGVFDQSPQQRESHSQAAGQDGSNSGAGRLAADDSTRVSGQGQALLHRARGLVDLVA